MSAQRVAWAPVLEDAAAIVESYDTGVTLRQLHYRLVAALLLPNLQSYYRRLSSKTAEGRRNGTFPDLLDRSSRIERYQHFAGPDEAKTWLRDMYRRDRTEGQSWTVYLGVEKDGMSEQLDAWFTDPIAVPHVALGGYASQSLVDQVTRDIARQGRPAVLIYAGDYDPTGEDIDRDFVERVGLFDKFVRVALHEEQVDEHGLVRNPDPEVAEKLERDPRGRAFIERHGSLVQYEVDALAPENLRNLYQNALDDYWDDDTYDAAIEREDTDREQL